MENRPSTPSLSIGRMNLRVPGRDVPAGERIARQTSELLAEGSTGLAGRQIGAMRLRVHAAPNASDTEIAQAVSRAILRHFNSPSDA